MLLQRESKDNEIAAKKGLKPYILLNVEFNDVAVEQVGGYLGWYYVTLAVDGKIRAHLETGLNYDIADGKVSDTPTRPYYYPAGALKETDVDYVFNNVAFSSTSDLYTLPLREDVRERAERKLAERMAAAKKRDADASSPIRETGETIRTPRGCFYVADMTVEQMEAAGYGVHHQSDDGKYLIMGNGKIAYAVPAQKKGGKKWLNTQKKTLKTSLLWLNRMIQILHVRRVWSAGAPLLWYILIDQSISIREILSFSGANTIRRWIPAHWKH